MGLNAMVAGAAGICAASGLALYPLLARLYTGKRLLYKPYEEQCYYARSLIKG